MGYVSFRPSYGRKRPSYSGMAGRSGGRKRARRVGTKRGRTWSGTSRKKASDRGGITQQHDSRLVYARKSMPRYKRTKWVQFSRKVNAVIDRGLGTKTVVLNDVLNDAGAAGVQGLAQCVLYGGRSSVTAAGFSDLTKIMNNEIASGNAGPNSKFRFESGVIDITFTNFSAHTLEVDLYEFDFYKTPQGSTDLVNAYNIGDSDTGKIIAGNTSINLGLRGVTPFDIPYTAALGGIRISKKIKYFISSLQCVTRQVRDPSYHTFSYDKIYEQNSWVVPKITKGFLFIVKSVPGFDTEAPGYYYGITRKYMYKILSNTVTADAYGL